MFFNLVIREYCLFFPSISAQTSKSHWVGSISKGIDLQNMILTSTCHKNQNPTHPFSSISIHSLCSFLWCEEGKEGTRIVNANGIEDILYWEPLQEVQATPAHGSCSDWLYFSLLHHWSFLRTWDEFLMSTYITYRHIVAGVAMLPFAYYLEK